MLENIKMVLGIATTDITKDGLIQYYINAVVKKILTYTNRIELPINLESVVEEIVVTKMQKSTGNTNNAKSEKIGDYEIEYSSYESDKDELDPFKKLLDKCIVRLVKTY